MEKPNECKWCGAKGGSMLWGCAIGFSCGSIFWIDDCIWTCDDDCADGQRNRIQRAVGTLKAAKRYTVTPVSRNALTWDTDPDGYVTDSAAVDKALAILEGERDET